MQCPCNLNNYNGYSSDDLDYLRLTRYIDNPNGYIRFQSCPVYKTLVDDYTYKLSDTFDLIEYTFDCSGWC